MAGVQTMLWLLEASKDRAQVSITRIRGSHNPFVHAYCALLTCRTGRLGRIGTHALLNLKRDDHTWLPDLLFWNQIKPNMFVKPDVKTNFMTIHFP